MMVTGGHMGGVPMPAGGLVVNGPALHTGSALQSGGSVGSTMMSPGASSMGSPLRTMQTSVDSFASGPDCVGCNDFCGAACGTGRGRSSGKLDYVGANRGAWTTQTSYRFVGPGLGEFDLVKTGPNYCFCSIIAAILVMLLLILLWFLFKDNVRTTTLEGDCRSCLIRCNVLGCHEMIATVGSVSELPKFGSCALSAIIPQCPACQPLPGCAAAQPSGPTQTCIVWGDPHLRTFDNQRVDFYTAGEYWIVKSETVFIQGAYQPTQATNGLSVLKELAVGGPFLQGHKLIVGALAATWDGQPILEDFPSSWQNELVTSTYDSAGANMQNGRQGKQLHVVHLSLPLNVKVEINRWMEPTEGNYINAKIIMSVQPSQDGHCGNFNGNKVDDDRLQIRARIGTTGVAVPDLLFPGVKTPIGESSRLDINDCPTIQLERAKIACKQSEGKFIPSRSCLMDACYGGPGFAQTDSLAER